MLCYGLLECPDSSKGMANLKLWFGAIKGWSINEYPFWTIYLPEGSVSVMIVLFEAKAWLLKCLTSANGIAYLKLFLPIGMYLNFLFVADIKLSDCPTTIASL